jgi:hypothetical protein
MRTTAFPVKPTFDQIAHLAFDIWEKEGRPHGRHMEHWLEAESLLIVARSEQLKTLPAPTMREHLQSSKSPKRRFQNRISHAKGVIVA